MNNKIIFKDGVLFVNGVTKNYVFVEKSQKVSLRFFEVSEKLKVSEFVVSKKNFKIKYKDKIFNSIKIKGGYYIARVVESETIEVEIII